MDEFIRDLQAGRPEAFERLVREYGDRIYRFVKRLAGERPAEDLMQEVFIRVHRSIESYRPEGRFESWLFTIASNLCIDHARRRKPEATVSELGGDLGRDSFTAASREPLESMENEERRRAILTAVDRLPFEQRQVFLLREEAGMSFREIAQLTGCPLNTALGRMHYAMEALRKSLKAYGMQ
jgi:RNA polymerase sigma-70 factor (ECF subfamily)